MSILSHIVARLSKPMLITPSYHKILCDVVKRHIDNPMTVDIMPENDEEDESEPYDMMPGVRVIPIHGAIGYRVSSLEKLCGICDIAEVKGYIEEAMQDENVETLLFDFNTPGGEVTGIAEAANMIVAAGKKKNCVAFTDTMCCSAGMWLALACNEIYATESSDLGSIGVYMQVLDVSKAYEQQGAKVEMFTSGPLKGMGAEGTSLTDAQKTYLQTEVDTLANKFKAFAKSRRPEIEDEDMQGQSISGEILAKKGVIDGLVGSATEIFE